MKILMAANLKKRTYQPVQARLRQDSLSIIKSGKSELHWQCHL